MNILSLDTSTTTLHLALRGNGFYEERLISSTSKHSDNMLSIIKDLLKSHNLEIKDLNLLLCTRGPGAFTSLRVGFATMKGFSLALGIPLISIPTLDVLANNVRFFPHKVITVIDAKKKRYYLGIYRQGKPVIKSLDGNAEDLLPYLSENDKVLVTGPDAKVFSEKLKSLSPKLEVMTDNIEERNNCNSLIELGLVAYENGLLDDIGQGPVYIRKSDAEEALLSKGEKK